MKSLVVHGMHGMGDNLYQRAVIRQVGPVFLHTPWPQLYADIPNVTCLKTGTRLRTQAKNESAAISRQYPDRRSSCAGITGRRSSRFSPVWLR